MMNSTKLSRAALAMLAMTAVGAHAQLTISGALDTSAESVKPGDPGKSKTQLSSGTATGSRIVFEAKGKMGDELTPFGRLELGLNSDTGQLLNGPNANFGRTAIVGLESSKWGQVAVGRTGGPMIPFLNQTDFGSIGYYGNNSGISQNIYSRISNGIFYTSPEMGGLRLRAVASAGVENEVAPKNQGNLLGVGAYYSAGKLNLAAAYQASKERISTNTTNLAVDDQTEVGLGGRYNFGWVTVNAGWYKIHQVMPAASRPATADKAIASDNTSSYWLGAVFPVGKSGNLGLQMGQTKGDLKVAGLPNPKATTMGVYYNHSINKDASVYINYGQVNNNAGSQLSLSSGNWASRLSPQIKGSDPSALAVGVIYRF
jgi:hypothetical protein